MIYADYEYYCDIYKGTVDADGFCRLATRASSFLDYYTQNRAKDFAASEAKKALASVAREYLAHTGLLYRGRCFACTPPTL